MLTQLNGPVSTPSRTPAHSFGSSARDWRSPCGPSMLRACTQSNKYTCRHVPKFRITSFPLSSSQPNVWSKISRYLSQSRTTYSDPFSAHDMRPFGEDQREQTALVAHIVREAFSCKVDDSFPCSSANSVPRCQSPCQKTLPF